MRMRVADYITDAIYQAGGEHVFLITGGMIMHLTDALYQHGKQKYVCCHHEQAAAMAAEAYGRFTGKLGAVYVTAGPGSLNAITGVVGAFVDSSPCIIVAGQSKASQALVKGPRQFALQGFNNLDIYKQITKYAVMLDNITTVKYQIEKAIYLATMHRVGPVYVECPIDLQGEWFDPDEYEGYIAESTDYTQITSIIEDQIDLLVQAIRNSKRPIFIAGAGVRLSGAVDSFHKLAETTHIPVLTSRLGMDLFGNDHPLFVGRPGLYGDRPANFAVQNCDLLISIGCRLGIGVVGYDYEGFAPHAKKIIVDVDENELNKPSVKADLAIQLDASTFIDILSKKLDQYSFVNTSWNEQTCKWKERYPVCLPEYREEKEGINSYYFTDVLSRKMKSDATFVLDTGSCFHVYAQAFQVKFGQRHIITGGLSTMGYMPGVIGVLAANQGKEVYCVTGDGSIQMNLQELQTIVHNNYLAKIIVFNNNGYLLIRNTQHNFQEGRLIGESSQSGVSFPDLGKIAKAYGLNYIRIESIDELEEKLEQLIACKHHVICEVITPSNQLLIPRIASKKLDDGRMVSMPYDDMFPFLPRDEYTENCVASKSK